MNKIESFSLHNLHNNEHFQFMTDFDKLIILYLATELGIDSLYPAFKSALTAEDTAIRIELGSLKSKTIEQLDKLRDRILTAISLRLKSTLLSPFDDEIESAEALKRVVDLYGDVRNISYNEESAALTNLVNNMQLPANETHIVKVGITTWVAELKRVNEQFITVFNERNSELSVRESGDVRPVRKQLDPIYEQMVEKINASIVLETAKPNVAAFVGEHNQKIEYYRTTLAARSGRKKGKDDKKEDDTPAS
jgi:SMC interacting uncharacterized protein involved in chromosome segregation